MKNNILKLKLKSDFWFKLLFQLIFWFFWLVLPFVNTHFDGDYKRFHMFYTQLPLSVLYFFFFYFNSEYLVKKFLPKGQITSYILSLLILFVVFLSSYYLWKDYLVDEHPIRIYDGRTLFPVLFIISMSTFYGLIVFMIDQSRLNQEENEQKLKSELSFLRSQISPHFIFNVLNSIVFLIRKKSEKAEQVTIELSELLRYMLYDSDHRQVPLEREVEYLKNYIELQKVRFGEDIEISTHISGDFEGKMIEPMLLIPFVENAFKHGVGFILHPTINIDLSRKGNIFCFSVSNKVGPEDPKQKDVSSGIGLKNVSRRLELLYPEKHTLEIKNEAGIFEIILTLELKNL